MLPKMITFVEDMAQKGLTKKQFWIQMIMVIFWELYAAYWIIDGIVAKSSLRWMAGAVFGLLYLAFAIYLIFQRKRYPIEDAQLDEQVGENFKPECRAWASPWFWACSSSSARRFLRIRRTALSGA